MVVSLVHSRDLFTNPCMPGARIGRSEFRHEGETLLVRKPPNQIGNLRGARLVLMEQLRQGFLDDQTVHGGLSGVGTSQLLRKGLYLCPQGLNGLALDLDRSAHASHDRVAQLKVLRAELPEGHRNRDQRNQDHKSHHSNHHAESRP